MDFKTLTDYIFDRLTPYKLARHYAFAEMLYDSEKEQSIPATYCENGEFKHVVNGYDWTEGICYIRTNGQQRSREDEASNFKGCEDMLLTTIPLRLVLINKRTRYSPYDLANVIASAVAGQYDTVASEIGAVYVNVLSTSTDSDIKEVLESEFGDIKEIKWDTSLLAIACDIEVEVKGLASCLQQPVCPSTWWVDAEDFNPTVLPLSIQSGDIVFLKSPNPIGFVTSFTNFPSGGTLSFKPYTNTGIVIANQYSGSNIVLDDGFNVSLENSQYVTLKSVGGALTQISGGGTTYPDGIYITGVNGSHEANVLATYLAEYPEAEGRIVKGYLAYADTGTPSASIFTAQLMQAAGYRCQQATASYVGVIANLPLQAYLSTQLPCVVLPIGPNQNIETGFSTMQDNSVIYISSGNETQRVMSYGNSLEFWDTIGSNSNAVPLIAAKLMQIADSRQDGINLFQRFVGARWAARATADRTIITHGAFDTIFDLTMSLGGNVWNKFNGYGKVNVSESIDYVAPVPTSIFVSTFDFNFNIQFS